MQIHLNELFAAASLPALKFAFRNGHLILFLTRVVVVAFGSSRRIMSRQRWEILSPGLIFLSIGTNIPGCLSQPKLFVPEMCRKCQSSSVKMCSGSACPLLDIADGRRLGVSVLLECYTRFTTGPGVLPFAPCLFCLLS